MLFLFSSFKQLLSVLFSRSTFNFTPQTVSITLSLAKNQESLIKFYNHGNRTLPDKKATKIDGSNSHVPQILFRITFYYVLT